jgi:carboxymethylenebutenolidase
MKDRPITAFVALALLSISPSLAQEAPKKQESAPAVPAQESLKPAPAQIETKGKPVDQSQAAAVLKDSSRHGEWVDVPVEGGTGTGAVGAEAPAPIKTWIVYPERADKAPVVIVIHEIFGMTEWVRATADQLAADGFIAIAPDLLSGKGPSGGATDSMKAEDVREAIRKLTADEVTSRLNAVREFAVKLPSAAPKVGCIGFCWGGSQSFRYAAAQAASGAKLGAAVVFYGTAPMKDSKPDTEVLAKVACPVLGMYGGNDARVTSTVAATDEAMKTLKKSFEQETYEGAGHGFVRQQSSPANTDAAKKAWARTVAFLKKHLE